MFWRSCLAKPATFQWTVWLFLICGSHAAAGKSVGVNDGLATASSRCGYDLSPLKPMLIAAISEPLPPAGVTVIFHLKSRRHAPVISAQLSINCVSAFNDATDHRGNVLDAKTVIQNEDSGGRYFRHVASQKLLNGRNWRANAALVDYVLGDAQRVIRNELFACNADVVAPCISLLIQRPRRLTLKSLGSLHSMLEQIAVIKVDGVAGPREEEEW